MSRIGKMPVTIPTGVEAKVSSDNHIVVKGPKGTLEADMPKDMTINIDNSVITITRPSDKKDHKALHGLTRSLVANMVIGVVDGYEKTLEVNGVGYRVAKQGNKIVMNLGYSHQVEMEEIPGITLEVPTANLIIVKGIDKQKVGQFAAKIREKRLPEPYKGKGIKYSYEVIKRKEGKTGAKKK